MEITERLCDAGASDRDIVQIEISLGTILPDSYRTFLRETNGGRPKPRDFDAIDGEEGSSVQFFFTLNAESQNYYIPKELSTYRNRIPARTLPIACDSFGNLILLDLGIKQNGAIYFWVHESENLDGDPWWDNVYLVASSFEKFILLLR